jgi:hypothetical protein
MALDTYANLQTSVANWLARPGDSNITANVGDMITLFEAEARRRLKTRFNETRTTLSTVAGTATVALPSDFGEMREITVAVGNADKVLVYAPPEQMDAAYPSEVTDESILYTIEGTNLRLKPIPGQVYSLSVLYMQGIVALSNGAPTNWLLTNHPDAYLFGALAEAEAFIGEDERIALWIQRRDASFASILTADIKARWSGGALQMRTDTGNP